MPAVADDGAFESLCKFRAGLRYFANRFSAAGIVVAGMNAVLVDGGSRAQHAQGVEEIYLVALFSEPNGGRRAVNAGSSYSDLRSHAPLSSFHSHD
jgi:hypothetical protein